MISPKHRPNDADEWDCKQAEEKLERALTSSGAPMKARRELCEGLIGPCQAIRAVDAMLSGDQTLLVLAGPGGRGKTIAGVHAIMECAGGIFLNATDLAIASWYDRERWSNWKSTGLLVLDDLGEEFDDSRGGFQMALDSLINARYNAERRTIITTNLTLERFRARYSSRVLRRIAECGRFLEITDPDLSRKVSARSTSRAQGGEKDRPTPTGAVQSSGMASGALLPNQQPVSERSTS